MKTWIEYYETETMPAMGDRGIVELDGRQSLTTWIADGHQFNGYRRNSYAGFKIIRGESLLQSTTITPFIPRKSQSDDS